MSKDNSLTTPPPPPRETSRDNNFNLIRFILASSVIISHGYDLTTGSVRRDYCFNLTGHSFAWYAVNGFFTVSGFLVSVSLFRRNNVIDFVRARVLRIYPGLLLMVFSVTLIMGLFFSTLTFMQFIMHHQTLRFVLGNSSLLNVQFPLPGVFLHNASPNSVNGSLWTLPYEAMMYVLLAGLAMIGGIKSKRVLTGSLIMAGCVYIMIFILPEHIRHLSYFVRVANFQRLGFCFLLGVIYMLIRNKLPHTVIIVITLVTLSALCLRYFPKGYETVASIALAYSLFWFAYVQSNTLKLFNTIPDFSYGIYIYAYPVQQSLIYWKPSLSPWQHIPLAWAVTLCFAIISWYSIEARSIALNKRLSLS